AAGGERPVAFREQRQDALHILDLPRVDRAGHSGPIRRVLRGRAVAFRRFSRKLRSDVLRLCVVGVLTGCGSSSRERDTRAVQTLGTWEWHGRVVAEADT